MELTVKLDGETYAVKAQYSRDRRKRLCGTEWCHFCRCHLRTFGEHVPGESHKRGTDWQGLVPCPEPCKRIKEKFSHLCKFEEVFFVKKGAGK